MQKQSCDNGFNPGAGAGAFAFNFKNTSGFFEVTVDNYR